MSIVITYRIMLCITTFNVLQRVCDVLFVGDSATYLYINEVSIRSAKVVVIAPRHLTFFVVGVVLF